MANTNKRKKNIFSNFSRIKCADVDFTPSMLPSTRKEVFFDALKLNWQRFLFYGAIFLAFFTPMILIRVNSVLQLSKIYAELSVATADERVPLIEYIYAFNNFTSLLKALSVVLLAIPMAGIINLIKKHSFDENTFFSTDVTHGLKCNIGQTLILGVIAGVVYFLSSIALNTLKIGASDISVLVLSAVAIPVSIFVGVPLLSYSIVSLSIYKNSFGQMIKLSFALYAKHPFKTLLAMLCAYSVLIIHMILNVFINHVVIEIVFSVVEMMILPVGMLGWYLFTLNSLDEVVNKTQYPQLVGKGTYKETTEQDQPDVKYNNDVEPSKNTENIL